MKRIETKIKHILYILGREISGIINSRFFRSEKKKILLFSSCQTMEEHLLNYWEQICGNENYVCFLSFGFSYPDGRKHPIEKTLFAQTGIKAIYNEWSLYFRRWDLIVCADMDYPFWVKRGTIPLLYIGHGVLNVSYDGGKHAYDYGKDGVDANGRPLFDVMLEPSRRIGEIMKKDAVFGNVVCAVGYRFAYRFREEASRIDDYKKALGISADRKVVSFFGSWNKESLFHVLGEELFAVCRTLKEKGYEFIFSIHPNEYSVYNPEIEPMGNLVEKQRDFGFFVRSPGEDWLPYMMASDVIVVDYTAMLSLAILSGKKVILSRFPEGKIWKESLASKVKHKFPVISCAEELEGALKELEKDVYDEMLEQFQNELYVSREDYQASIQKITKELILSRVQDRMPDVSILL